MTPELTIMLETAQLLKEAKEVVKKEAEQFRKTYKPQFKAVEDLKEFLLTPPKKRQVIFKF